jgi:NAD(P)-dependent dehydrogenase (short-subunit alcohol dehydrogenase family)
VSRCDGKVVLVTGAASGIGAATAALFAAAVVNTAIQRRCSPS